MHWYYPSGQPCFEIPNKSKPGTMRPVNLRDAKTLDLIPSVTTIQKAADKDGLNHWILSNAILAASGNPRLVGESPDVYIERIVDISEAESLKARDIGTQIHDYIECVLSNKTIIADYSAYTNGLIEWFRKEFKGKNFSFEKHITPTFYAGRTDACCDELKVVIDWKTQKTKGGKFIFYPEMPEQLAAYAKAMDYQNPRLISAMISTSEIGLFEIKEWSNEYTYWYSSFEALYKVWSVRNNYGLFKRGV